jgi:outer membrane receptor protein involved in Fe transport
VRASGWFRLGTGVAAVACASAWTAAASVALAQGPIEASERNDFGSSEQDREALLELLNTPVVTAGGAEEEAALAPANVFTVTAEEIAYHGWRSIAEALANAPGLFVVDDHVLSSVSVRGVTGGLGGGTRVVKIMINSVPVNFRPDLSAFLGPEYIPIEAVDRIEIAKGPLSALYGANAFLATVNVITKRPSSGARAEVAGRTTIIEDRLGPGTSGLITYGETHLSLLAAFTLDQTDRSGLSVERTFAGQDPVLAIYRRLFNGSSANDIARRDGGYAQLRWESDDVGALSVQAGFQQFDAIGDFQLNSFLTHQSRYALTNIWSEVHHEKNWTSDLSSAVSLGYATGSPSRDEKLFLTGNNDFAYRRNFDYQAFDANARIKYALPLNLFLTAGGDGTIEPQHTLFYSQIFNVEQGSRMPGQSIDLIAGNDKRTITLSNVGLFAQLNGAPLEDLPNLRLSGNFRLDFPNLFPAQYSWRVAAAYRWSEELVTKFIVGRAFQAPSGVLLYGLPGFGFANNIVGARTQSAIPDLIPQVLHSVEAVVSSQLFDLLALEVGAFYQKLDHGIEFVQLSSNFVPENLDTRDVVGAEAVARFKLSRITPYILGAAQLDITHDTDTGKRTLSTSPPPAYPIAMAIAGVTGVFPELFFSANAQVRFMGARGGSQSNVLLNNEQPYTLKPYAEIDVALATKGVKLLEGAGETRVSATARNLLDIRHSEPGFGGADVPASSRTFLIELRQNLE